MSFARLSDRPSFHIHKNGHILTSDITADIFESSLKYVPNTNDIFIVTYPKCGTTWAQYILYLMRNSGKPLEVGQDVNEFIPFLDETRIEEVTKLPPPRTIKSHLPFPLVPKSRHAKYIYITRNPKDCCVSFYNHSKGYKCYNFEDGTFDEYFELFLKGKVDSGDYFDHVLSWIKHKDDSNVLFLLYEDMKSDTVTCIKRIGHFLSGKYQAAVEDPVILENILKYSSFDQMKQTQSIWSSPRPEPFSPFIRKGVVGDWKNYFSEEQSKRLDEKFKAKFSGTEATFLWNNYGF